ncbi:unnamed protein product, partial [Adineta ricciae]
MLNLFILQELCAALEGSETEEFIEELKSFLNKQGKNISLKFNHNLESTNCSGNIVSIELVCKCQNDCNESINSDSKSQAMSVSYEYEAVGKWNNLSIEYEDASIPSVDTPLRLVLSPASLSSPELCPETNILTSTPKAADKSNRVIPTVLDKKDILSPMKTLNRVVIDEEHMELLTFLQRNTESSSFFTCDMNIIQETERAKSIIISQSDMGILKKLREEEQKKTEEDGNSETSDSDNNDNSGDLKGNSSSDDSDDSSNALQQKRNLEWTVIMDGYIQQSNDYCVFVYERHYFSFGNKRKKRAKYFMSISAHCKFSTCTCTFKATIDKNGKLKVNYKGQIRHLKGEIHSRPQRGSRRQKLQQLSALGVSPNALHLEQYKRLTENNKKSGNRNVVGSSPSVIRKISSEGNVKSRRHDKTLESLHKIKEEQAKTIYPSESLPGYLQAISADPLRVICFTAGGLRVYQRCALNMPLSWDATGGIVINRQKRIYYYELTMQNLIKKGPSFPITVMLSESHGTGDIVHWMNYFKEKYKETFGFRNTFPKPPIIHSDRALVFLLAAIEVFNFDETMARYIERCWRIVQGTANKRDLELTIIHACLGHFMKNVKRNATKELSKKQVPFGMWLAALLVNSSTLDEMIIVWENICIVLISTNQNDRFKMSLSLLSQMADKMNKDPDKANDVLKNVTVTSKIQFQSNLDKNAYENDENDLPLGEEDAVLQIESPFKELFTKIYEECKETLKVYDEPQWNNLPNNPLFSATYLTRLLKLYMPTAPIWSNLLLGNFTSRYGYNSNFATVPCCCHTGRTTGVSESRMRVLKEAILRRKVYSRIDEVVTKLGESIEAVECQFADFIFMKNNKNHVLPATKQKKAAETWAKRTKTTASIHEGYTSGSPNLNLTGMMNARLLGQNDDENLAIGQLPELLKFENKANNCWFNSIMQMILSSGQIVEAIIRMGPVNADVEPWVVMVVADILHSLTNKHKSRNKIGKTIVDQKFISEQLLHLVSAGVNI